MLGGKQQPVQAQGKKGSQPAFAVMHAEDQPSAGFERGAAALQQRELLLGGQILQYIENQNQTGWGQIVMTHVANGRLCVQCAQSLTGDGDSMHIEVASQQATALVCKCCKTERHTVAAAQIDHCSRAQVFGCK